LKPPPPPSEPAERSRNMASPKTSGINAGTRFGRLLVIGPGEPLHERVKCDCGEVVEKRRGDLRAGSTRRCTPECRLGPLKPKERDVNSKSAAQHRQRRNGGPAGKPEGKERTGAPVRANAPRLRAKHSMGSPNTATGEAQRRAEAKRPAESS